MNQMNPSIEARFVLEKLTMQDDKGVHEEWTITEAENMEHIFGLPSSVLVHKLLSQVQLFTPIYQRILCMITNMSLLLMYSTEATARYPTTPDLPNFSPDNNAQYNSDSSGNEYLTSESTSSNSILKTPLSSSPASMNFYQNFNNNNMATQTSTDIASSIMASLPDQLPISSNTLIMEGYCYLYIANNTPTKKVVPVQVQIVDIEESRKLFIVTRYPKIASIIYSAATALVLHSYDTEAVFQNTPVHVRDLLPESSFAELMTQQPPSRKKLIGRRQSGEQMLLSTRTEEMPIDPNRPKDTYITTFAEITRWMVPLVIVTQSHLIWECNTFFQDVFGFIDWRKRPLAEFLKKDERYGTVFTERISNIQIPVRIEKLEPAFTVHNWYKGLIWYAILPVNLPDCWVRYTPMIEDYLADIQLATDLFYGYSKLSENKVTVKLVPFGSDTECLSLQRVLELRHPNIATIEGVFQRDGVAFVVTRCPGRSLAKILEVQIFMPADHAIAVLVRLVAALWFCHHQRKIAHGNISFENVLVDDKWNPYLTGFGARTSFDGNPERFREDIRQLYSIFLALLSGLARPPPEFFTSTLVHHSVEIRELVNLLHNPQCTLKDIISHSAVQNFLKAHTQMKPTFY